LRAYLALLLIFLLSGCLGKSGEAGEESPLEIQDVEARKEEVTSTIPSVIAGLDDPVPATNESINEGEEIFKKFCSFCHGESGTGDPAFKQEGKGAFQPADLREWQDRSDGELFFIITNGVEGTEMLSWGEVLTERQRWDLINFVRTFEEQ